MRVDVGAHGIEIGQNRGLCLDPKLRDVLIQRRHIIVDFFSAGADTRLGVRKLRIDERGDRVDGFVNHG